MKKLLIILIVTLLHCYIVTLPFPVFAQSSRPYSCPKPVYNQTDLLTPSCATSFEVKEEVQYYHSEANFWCEDNPWLERQWGGTITIDPSKTTIPFVGKKDEEDEEKYLADYFEGTGFYYRPPYDFSNLDDVRRVLAEGGVWRKLAPLEVQDDLKKQMIQRALDSQPGQEGAIHDYLVEYNGESARLSQFDGHFPPEDLSEREKWEKETRWGRLWPAVPMFSREDTPGEILPYLGSRPRDQFKISNPEAKVEKVPHLARLYEVSQAINQLLLPYQEVTLPPPPFQPSQPIQPSPPACGLAEPLPVESCDQEAITDSNPNDDLCCDPINIQLTAVDQFINEDYEECQYEWVCDPITNFCQWKLKNPSCLDWEPYEVNRKIGINLLHPYLKEIWDYTTDNFRGFFNLFRSETIPKFEDLAAASEIKYRYGSGEVKPSVGNFYFPYLGGIQRAKEWVTKTLAPWKD